MNICFESWCQLWPLTWIAGLQRLADLPEVCRLCKQTGNLDRELISDLCAWIHWTIGPVTHISGSRFGAHFKQVMIMIDKQIFIRHAYLLENLQAGARPLRLKDLCNISITPRHHGLLGPETRCRGTKLTCRPADTKKSAPTALCRS